MLIANCQLLFFKDHASTAWAASDSKIPVFSRCILSFFIRLVKRELVSKRQTLALEAAFENLFYITAPMQDGNNLERLGIRPIDDEVGVYGEKLYWQLCQVPAPVSSTGISCQKSDLVQNG
jgi:hypothetical protein